MLAILSMFNIEASLPVRPSFEWALIVVTRRNIAAGTTCTLPSKIKPHSRPVRKSIIFFDSCDLLCVFAATEYVDTRIPLSPANWAKGFVNLTLIYRENQPFLFGRQ